MKGDHNMLHIVLTYGNEGIQEIKEFIDAHHHKEYTLHIYNIPEQATIEIICDIDSIIDVLHYISNIEHTFPDWIRINELSDAYVIGMEFTRGHLHTPSICEWKGGQLITKE